MELREERKEVVAQIGRESAGRRAKPGEPFESRFGEAPEGLGGLRGDFSFLLEFVDLQTEHFSAAESAHARRIEGAQNFERAPPVVRRNPFVRLLSENVEGRGEKTVFVERVDQIEKRRAGVVRKRKKSHLRAQMFA